MAREGENDAVLTPLFRATDERLRHEAIQAILATHAAPHIDRLLNESLGGRVQSEQRQDLSAEIMLRLFRRLRHLAAHSGSEPIRDFADYVATTTHNVLDDQRRRHDPLRSRLALRVRYVLTHTPGLSLWGRDRQLCGLASWKDRTDAVEPAPMRLIPSLANDAAGLRRILEDVLGRSGGPVDVLVLVDRLAQELGIERRAFVSTDVLRDRSIRHDPFDRLAGRQSLDRLWTEIQHLPERQRRALLLQMRLEDGESVCRVFVALGVVTMNELARTMEMRPDELVSLWNDLPLGDQRIAAMVGATRQQVINLRKSARERLARRMKRGK